MTTTSAAENLAGNSGEKEKVEKRRALGRGLESLLPGPRVVVTGPQAPPSAKEETVSGTGRVGSPVQEIGSGSEHPHVSQKTRDMGHPTADSAAVADIQAVVTETISIQAQAEGRTPSNLIVNVELDQIDKNPYQTRYDFDEETLEELAESIRVQGVVQPVVVRPGEDGRYVLILGERRCRASKMAGRTTVPAIVKRVSDQQAAEMTIIENLQRQDLNCLEQAEAFRVLSKEFNLTQQQIGERVGMSRESVSNYMRLLKLSKRVMEHILAGRIRFTEARELLKIEDPEKIEAAAERVVKEEMKFEQIETMVARMTGWLDPVPGLPGQERKKSGARWVDPNVRAAQMELERLLQVRVRIKDRKGKGKIIIEYSTVDDYDRVVEALKGKSS